MGRRTSATQTSADTQTTIRQPNKQMVQSEEKGSKGKQEIQFKQKLQQCQRKH